MNLSPSLLRIPPQTATSILSRFLAYEIAVPISQPEKTLEFQNYKLIFFIYLYLLFSLNVVNELCALSAAHSVNLKKTELLIPESASLRHLIQLNRELVSNLTPKRRCSSHTFRYGYLVTT